MAQQNSNKTTRKMWHRHSTVAENSSVLGCDTVCLVSSSEVGWCLHLQSSILRRMLVYWTHWHWRRQYDPSNPGNFSSKSRMSHHKLLESSTELRPSLLFFVPSQWVKALTNDSKHNYLLIKQTIWSECSPLRPHTQQNLMSHTHLHWTVSTFLTANVGAWMFTR